jgi:acyl-CoA thioesterase FadM
VRFHSAAGLHDRLTISTELIDIRRASTSWRQAARIGDRLVAELEARAAFTDTDGRPIRPPDGFSDAVARAIG